MLIGLSVDGYAHARCHCVEPLVQGPQLTSLNCCGSEQVNVHITNASTVKFLRVNECRDLVVLGDGYDAQLSEKFKRF